MADKADFYDYEDISITMQKEISAELPGNRAANNSVNSKPER
jgi:hypothetical protein